MSYSGKKASLLTQHGKQDIITPELFNSIGLEVVHVKDFDTDQLGTFTRDIPRYGSQLDAARRKARLGMNISGLTLGIASEGAFSADPYTGIFPWNYEIVIFIDEIQDLEVVGHFGGPAQSASKTVSNWTEVEAFLGECKFPEHQLVIRPDDELHSECIKGIKEIESLKDAFRWATGKSREGNVFLENDLRAHTNPTRMANIMKATQDLSQKLASLCPQCSAPGFWITQKIKGLPCSECATPTHLPIADVWSCTKCNFKRETKLQIKTADPSRCPNCNP